MTSRDHKRSCLGSLLIVEDDVALAEILSKKLRDEGYKVVAVDTSHDAISRLRNQRFDCVILDLILRKGVGEELIPVLRNHWRDALVPVIVTSGSLTTDLVRRIASHVKRAFVKPYDLDVLVQQVKEVTLQNATEGSCRSNAP